MLQRPSSPDGIFWYVYKARRKIHVLRTRKSGESKIINRTHPDSRRPEYFTIFLNSTCIFLFSYLVIYVLKELVVVVAAKSFNINAVMMYFDIDFLIRSKDWTNEAVKVVYSVEPLFTLILGFIALIFFFIDRK